MFANAYSAEPVHYVAATVGPDSFFAIGCQTDVLGVPGKCELYELFMDEYFNRMFLQTSILNHHTFLFSFCAVLPVPIVFPLHNVADSAGSSGQVRII